MTNSYNQMMNNQESNIKKPKKTINVSIQSKKYSVPINKILDKWENNGLNASNEVSENILLVDKLNKSITFCSMFNIYELVEKMVGLYDDLDSPSAFMKIEKILSQVITIDNSKLSSVLAQLNEESMGQKASNRNNDYNDNYNYNEKVDTSSNNNNRGNNTNNSDYMQSMPQRRSPQLNEDNYQNNTNNYNNQNNYSNPNNNSNQNMNNNSNQNMNNTDKDMLDSDLSIPLNFLSND